MNSWKEFAGHCNQRWIAASAVKQHPILQILTSQPSSKLGSFLNQLFFFFSPLLFLKEDLKTFYLVLPSLLKSTKTTTLRGRMSLTSQFSYFSVLLSLYSPIRNLLCQERTKTVSLLSQVENTLFVAKSYSHSFQNSTFSVVRTRS